MFNINKINELIEQGYIKKTKHPTADLFIYNYTAKTQYEELWTEETKMCRGLILDANNNIIARPLEKFFNVSQHTGTLPDGQFKVYEKLDGSMGCLFWLEDKPYIATRGSFSSEMADFANKYLVPKYLEHINNFDRDYTYIFEIISPVSKIVVNYDNAERLVLLAVRHTSTGEEIDIDKIDYPDKARLYDAITEFEAIATQPQMTNEEGFVIKWENGFRLKFKFDEYVRLHRIITGTSNKSIWQFLKDGQDFNELLDRVPDEWYKYVKETKLQLEHEFNEINEQVKSAYNLIDKNATRKEQALYIMKNHKDISGLLFAMLDGKDCSDAIWKRIEPEFSQPYIIEDEN